mgnify:CR=1 FL=1
MSEEFYKKPILNSPYEYPSRHWQLDDGVPTTNIIDSRRRAEFISPVPSPKARSNETSKELFDEDETITIELADIYLPVYTEGGMGYEFYMDYWDIADSKLDTTGNFMEPRNTTSETGFRIFWAY